jgi:hypothetical protein
MTIIASPRQRLPLPADLPAATVALAHIAGPGPQLDPSASINKAALNSIYLLNPHRSIKQPISSTRRHTGHPAPRSKSP